MMDDTAYHLSARDMLRILQLISQLKEGIAELLAHRHVFLPMEEFDDTPTTSEPFDKKAKAPGKLGLFIVHCLGCHCSAKTVGFTRLLTRC